MTALDAIALQTAATQANVAQAVLKASARSDQQIANILEQSATVPVASGRGNLINFSA